MKDGELLDGRIVEEGVGERAEGSWGHELSVGGSGDIGEHRDEGGDVSEFGSESGSDDVVCEEKKSKIR